MSDFDDQENGHEEVRFHFPYSLDRDSFFRRQCPKCGLHFKIKASSDTIATLLTPTFERIGVEYGYTLTVSSPDNEQEKDEVWNCPYCRHQDSPQEFITDELYGIMRLWIYREYIYPLVNDQLSQLAREINRMGRHSGGFVKMSMRHDPEPLPPRPINYPDLPDMNTVILLCCHKEIKIKSGWFGTIICPYCSKELMLT